MNLSPNFTLEELTTTHSGLSNIPNQKQIDNLTRLVNNALQPAREALKQPTRVNSGFRSKAVNEAVDNTTLFDLIRTGLLYDQLIWKGSNDKQPDWIHVSSKAEGNRQQTLKMAIIKGEKTYIVI